MIQWILTLVIALVITAGVAIAYFLLKDDDMPPPF